MEWLKKIAGYAPDIVSAIATGGATLPATALRIVSKELLGYETDNVDLVASAVDKATPDQLLALKQCNNDFIVRRIELRNAELANQRADTQNARREHKGHWMTWLLPLLMFGLFSTLVFTLIKYTIPTENRELLVFLAGQVSGFMAAGVTFWLGSSRGSAEKSTMGGK